jgi:hypothetical protein
LKNKARSAEIKKPRHLDGASARYPHTTWA